MVQSVIIRVPAHSRPSPIQARIPAACREFGTGPGETLLEQSRTAGESRSPLRQFPSAMKGWRTPDHGKFVLHGAVGPATRAVGSAPVEVAGAPLLRILCASMAAEPRHPMPMETRNLVGLGIEPCQSDADVALRGDRRGHLGLLKAVGPLSDRHLPSKPPGVDGREWVPRNEGPGPRILASASIPT